MLLLGALTLSACGEMSPEEEAQMAALLACSERADSAFPVLTEMPDTADEETSDEFRVDPAGAYVWTAKVRGKGRPLPDELICSGSLKDRTVEFIELNGVRKRPQPQEVWKF